jgi:hypothetical protein
VSYVAHTKRIVQSSLVFHANSFKRVYLEYFFRFSIHIFKFSLLSSEIIRGHENHRKDLSVHTGFGRLDENSLRKNDRRPAGANVPLTGSMINHVFMWSNSSVLQIFEMCRR